MISRSISSFLLLTLLLVTTSNAFVSTTRLVTRASPTHLIRRPSFEQYVVQIPYQDDYNTAQKRPAFELDFVDASPAKEAKSFLGARTALFCNFLASSPLLWLGIKTWTGLFWGPYTRVLQNHGINAALLCGASCTYLLMMSFFLVASLPPLIFTSTKTRRARIRQMQRDGPTAIFNNVCGLTLLLIIIKTCTSSRALFSSVLPSTNFVLNFVQYVFIAAVNEFLFFFLHKLQHSRKENWLVKYLSKIHVRHHTQGKGREAELLPIGAAVMHPVEYLLVVGISAIAGPALLGATPVLAFSWYAMAAVTAGVQHAGWTCSDMGMHKGHHVNPNVNLGVYGLLDCVYGTLKLLP